MLPTPPGRSEDIFKRKLKTKMKFSEIKKFTGRGEYHVNAGWSNIESQIDHYKYGCGASLKLNPDFQRGHVWTKGQQVAYVEYGLRGGMSGMDVCFNCAGWMRDFGGPFVLVDGLQRLTAVREFMGNRLAVFGRNYLGDFADKMNWMRPAFNFHINDLKTREEVLVWYLELNSGGVVHTEGELKRVRALLDKERE